MQFAAVAMVTAWLPGLHMFVALCNLAMVRMTGTTCNQPINIHYFLF